MEDLQVQWSQLAWSQLPAMVASYPSNLREMHPLLENSLESLSFDLTQLCSSDLCVLGVFALQLMALSGMLLEGSVTPLVVQKLLERNVGSFVNSLKDYLPTTPSSLYSDFGSHRSTEQLTLPELALQLLGRNLYQLAELPKPPGPRGDEQFAFGQNWQQFVEGQRISVQGLLSSVREVREMVGGAIQDLKGLSVLDLGCGSGLSSLAFRLLGASPVTSVDLQPASLEATRQLRGLFEATPQAWRVAQASALEAKSLAALGPVDIVYTWGVLHHTGDVWQAIHNAQLPLAEDGLLLLAVYADEFYDEKDNIIKMKDFYRKASMKQQEHLDIGVGIYWLRPQLKAGKNPFEVLRNFSEMRGMDFWTDVRDWLGGWPTQFVSTSAVLSFIHSTGLRCVGVRRNGGNTEFALTRPGKGVARWTAGRVCEGLTDFQEDASGTFFALQQKLYYWPLHEVSPRRWWYSSLPQWMRNHSDDEAEPQKNRLLLTASTGEPFGYPTAHFARPDALRDPRNAFYAFWEGRVYISPAPQGVAGLQACLLPAAELSQGQEAEIRGRATRAGLK